MIETGVDVASIRETQIVRWEQSDAVTGQDMLSVEEPLEIRLAGCSVAVTMRTPGHDLDLAAGFLFTEGIIHGMEDIASIGRCQDGSTGDALSPNIVNINPVDHRLVTPERWRRHFFATSSCGICGKASIDAIRQNVQTIRSALRIAASTLARLDVALRRAQAEFGQTGGLHAAGFFDLQGRLLSMREDVGRHNAVDKVIGDALQRNQLPLSDGMLMVSGRASFEIVQKALVAGIPILGAISAPSSLAVDLARSCDMTLAGFLRSGRFNVYSGNHRVTLHG